MGYPKAPFVVVYWKDHTATAHWLDDDEEIDEAAGTLCRSQGYLFRQDAEVTVICSAQAKDGMKGCSQTIMTVNVVKIVKAEETGERVKVKR